MQVTADCTKANIRYVEARRIGTCAFANRIAQLSKEHYTTYISETVRNTILPQTCIATIVAAFHNDNDSEKGNNCNATTILDLKVLAMGVGTKFLSELVLRSQDEAEVDADDENLEIADTKIPVVSKVNDTVDKIAAESCYGTRIRDCHAEVLCRRAFRKYLLDCIEDDILLYESNFDDNHCLENDNIRSAVKNNFYSILQPSTSTCSGNDRQSILLRNHGCYRLRSNVTLHMYCSSTPCGNSTIKKFATFSKEQYCTKLSMDEWPDQYELHNSTRMNKNDKSNDILRSHNQSSSSSLTMVPSQPVIIGHSIPLGQFAVLVKKDAAMTTSTTTNTTSVSEPQLPSNTNVNQQKRRKRDQHHRILSKKEQTWPINTTTDWCPPGTTTVWSNNGSIHTCSDKIGRWNYLGLQGSLLSSILEQPIYISTITVGRKFSSVSCRRALCCRFVVYNKKQTTSQNMERPISCTTVNDVDPTNTTRTRPMYEIHHPTVMGTNVYLDETGVIDMTTTTSQTTVSVVDYSNNDANNIFAGEKSRNDEQQANSNIKSNYNRKEGGEGEVRFHSSMSFVTWLKSPKLLQSNCCESTKIYMNTLSGITSTNSDTTMTTYVVTPSYEIECVDGSTGFLFNDYNHNDGSTSNGCATETSTSNLMKISMVSSISILKQFLRVASKIKQGNCYIIKSTSCSSSPTDSATELALPRTLKDYRQLKWNVAETYELVKHNILNNHPVLRDWKRRYVDTSDMIKDTKFD